MDINYNDMVIFARIVEFGGFTNASKKLGIPKSTISKRLSSLEQRLNVRLLNRSTRTISLSSIGEQYLKYCQEIIQIGNHAEKEISNVQDMISGSLKITCPEVSASYFMNDIIKGFTELYPSIAIELIVDDSYIDIVESGIDFAFRVGKLTDSNLICRQLGKVSRVLVASPSYLNEYGRPVKITDLNDHSCLLHTQLKIWPFTKSSKRKNYKAKGQLVSNSLFFILKLALSGRGIALLPKYLVKEYIEKEELEIIMSSFQIPENSYYLIQVNNDFISKTHSAFVQYVMQFGIGARLLLV